MKKMIFLLLCTGFAAHSLEAQERPAKYFASVLSRYEYRGVEIHKGDQLHLKNGEEITVGEIQKYKIGYNWQYYINGKDAAGKEVWYDIATLLDHDGLQLPEGVVLKDKITFGPLPAVNGKIIYEYVGEVAGKPKDKIFDQVLSELARMIGANEESLQVQLSDKEEGHILAQAGFTLSYGRLLDLGGIKEMRFGYVFDIRIKDGRYRLQLSDFRSEVCSVTGKWGCYPVSMQTVSNSQQQRDKDVTTQFDAHNKRFLQYFEQGLLASANVDNW